MYATVLAWMRLYWAVAIGPLGAILFAIAALEDVGKAHPYLRVAVLILGGVFVIYGAIKTTKYTTSIEVLSTEIKLLKGAKDKRTFLILAAFTEEFQVGLNFHLLKIGRESDLFMHVLCPSQDFAGFSVKAMQNTIVQNPGEYSGGILLASQFADDSGPELESFAAKIGIPVVFVDHVPPPSGDTQPKNVTWVTVRDDDGGRLAAQAVVDFEIEPQRILVIAGFAKSDRQDAFKEYIAKRWPKCVVRVTTDGGFSRQKAEMITTRMLREALQADQPYEVVFCTSDSMTLGCLDAINNCEWQKHAVPQVIGYDGLEVTQRLILQGNTPLKRVVVQDQTKMADHAVRALQNLKAGQSSPVVWIKPTLFPALDQTTVPAADFIEQLP
jgi:ABC-type sugar transport system substrate-binding protein